MEIFSHPGGRRGAVGADWGRWGIKSPADLPKTHGSSDGDHPPLACWHGLTFVQLMNRAVQKALHNLHVSTMPFSNWFTSFITRFVKARGNPAERSLEAATGGGERNALSQKRAASCSLHAISLVRLQTLVNYKFSALSLSPSTPSMIRRCTLKCMVWLKGNRRTLGQAHS